MDEVVVIGAGVGGLAAAMRLSTAGLRVTVLDRHPAPGGKMRVVDSLAGPIDAGPTVLTLRHFFESIFEACGTSLDAHVTLRPLEILARHHWQDGSSLDLYADYDRSRDAIAAFAGAEAARQFAAFHRNAAGLFRAFEAPMMRAAEPSQLGAGLSVARRPWLVPSLTPGRSMATALRTRFRDKRLRQLFGRYATYVGGYPAATPALLSLIWYAESQGVWTVDGGMHALAQAMQGIAERAGAGFRLGTAAESVVTEGGRVTGVRTADGVIPADAVLFNGDPKALRDGRLGADLVSVVPQAAVARRSLSAYVWTFAARPTALQPHRHSVFFAADPQAEFDDIAAGRMPSDPTLYIHAQDRAEAASPEGAERFEIIVNGPPRQNTTPDPEEARQCRKITFDMLDRMGLSFDTRPEVTALTAPEDFNRMFPGSDGSLYGLSPNGLMSAFRRPRARTALPGLYLCGGGAHPGAGIPMASTSGLHAAEAIMQDLASTSPSRRTAMPGGMSTASRMTANGRSRSSHS
ncbi:1-hydroxycarotenoid 3,4-desaturase CrtD [Jannaschia aquimarina]|uniref:CrtD protein n=1 Tax=Jannaschia aquimarina TaxID=935700 RepID=A0A0D1EDB3_9RHOB|nr:1-hydroxycarotenoid 3,4-desaturase CrtD [Jannaschia aquimarina]KIT14911.1 Hydroxyneurosporene desaturase [Jannaschia aquimarina]SNS59115.1 1-hydroxycarotenoid 3,4-desaturase [Jannaschia aquimarina]